MKKFNPGDKAPETTFYRIVSDQGKTLSSVMMNKGERFPPLDCKNCYYVLDD